MKRRRAQRTVIFTGLGSLLGLVVACGVPAEDDPPDMLQTTPEVGKTYLVRVAPADWSPPGVGNDIAPYVPGFLLRVDSARDLDVDVTIGTAGPTEPAEQDVCTATKRVTGRSHPGVRLGPVEYRTYLVNRDYAVNATVHDLELLDVFPDGSNGSLTATLDFRDLSHLFTDLPTADPNVACRALPSIVLDAACAPCPDGESFCVTIAAAPVMVTEFDGEFEEVADAACPEKLRQAVLAGP